MLVRKTPIVILRLVLNKVVGLIQDLQNFSQSRISRITIKRVIFLLAIPTILYLSLLAFVIYHTFPQSPQPADVIIIPGARAFHNYNHNPCLVSRINKAAALYHQNLASTIIVSGGTDQEDGANEADVMQFLLTQQNIPSEKILLERTSTSTYQNLLLSKQIMQNHNLQSAIVVSEPFHLARIHLVANSLNIPIQTIATTDSPCWTTWRYLSRFLHQEPLKIIYYTLTGRINAGSTVLP